LWLILQFSQIIEPLFQVHSFIYKIQNNWCNCWIPSWKKPWNNNFIPFPLNIVLYYWSNITIFMWFFIFNFLLVLTFHLNNSLHQLNLFKFCVIIISWMTSFISLLRKTFKFSLSNFELLLGSKRIHSRVVKTPPKRIRNNFKIIFI